MMRAGWNDQFSGVVRRRLSRSSELLGLAASTQKTYRAAMERVVEGEKIGHRLVRERMREPVRRIVSKRADTSGAANSVLQKLKALLHFGRRATQGDGPWREHLSSATRKRARSS